MATRASAGWTVSGASVRALVAYVRSRGVDLGDVLATLGLTEQALAQPELRVEAASNDVLWREASERLGDPDLGLHFAQHLDVDGFHIVVHLALTSRTVGEALARIVAYSRLLHDAGRTEVEHTKDGRVLLFPGCRGLPAPPLRHIAEFNSASGVLLIRMMTGLQAWRPLGVAFTFPRPASTTTQRQIFGVEPTYCAVEDCIVLDEATLALKTRTGDSEGGVAPYLERYAQTLLGQLAPFAPEESLRGQVLRAIVTGLAGGGVTLETVAARLAMTPRTLQRRLAASRDSFAALVDEARHNAASHYLRDSALPLAEISFLLGFQDPATFNKAFKRWTGQTPGAFRDGARVTGESTSSPRASG